MATQPRPHIWKYAILVRKAPIEGAIQKGVPKLLRSRILNLSEFSLLVTYPGDRKM